MARTTIVGLARLNHKLKRLPQVAKEMIRQALAEQADQIVATMQSLAHGDRLIGSIGWVWGTKAPKGSMSLGTVKAAVMSDLAITIYAGNAEVFWARWEEFGTAPHTAGGKFEGAEHPGTKGRPFFFPAWRQEKKKVRRKIAAASRKAAKIVAAGN